MADLDDQIRRIVREELDRRTGAQTNVRTLSGVVLSVNPNNTVDVVAEGRTYAGVGAGRTVAIGENVLVVVSGSSVGVI